MNANAKVNLNANAKARPVRALLVARLQLLWNSAHRGEGLRGSLSALAISLIAAALLIPPFLMFRQFGETLGQDLPADGSPAMAWLAGLHLLILAGMGCAAGLRHQAGFDQDLLKQFPLRPLQIIAAEIPFNLIDTIPVLGFTFYLGLGAGLLPALPSCWPHVLLAIGHGMLGLLLVQQSVGALRRLVSRSRALAAVAAIVVGLGVALVLLAAGRGLDAALATLVTWLPPVAPFSGLLAASRGEFGRAWMFQGIGLASSLALLAITVRLQLAEMNQDPPLRRDAGSGAKPWTFRNPAQGIARLFIEQILGARHGKLLLLLPLFCTAAFVLAADILRRSGVPADPTSLHGTIHSLFARVAAWPLYLYVQPAAILLVNKELWLNQFAWSGGGVKALLLAPISMRDILHGHLQGLLLLQVPQGLLACAPLARLGGPGPFELLTGLGAAVFVGIILAGFGHVASARFPRALVGREERAEGLPAQLMLVTTALIAALGCLVFGVVRLASPVGAWAPAAAFGALALLALGAHRLLLPALAARVQDAREHLAERLG